MIARLSKRMASFFVCNEVIKSEDEEVYEYGLQLLLVLKIKPCKRNNRQNSDHTKNAAKEGNAEERPDAGCGIKR